MLIIFFLNERVQVHAWEWCDAVPFTRNTNNNKNNISCLVKKKKSNERRLKKKKNFQENRMQYENQLQLSDSLCKHAANDKTFWKRNKQTIEALSLEWFMFLKFNENTHPKSNTPHEQRKIEEK